MNIFATLSERLSAILDIGGPVVLVLLALSVVSVGMIIFKLVQFAANGVGRRAKFTQGLDAWDNRDLAGAKAALRASKNGRAHIISAALDQIGSNANAHDRVEAELSAEFDRLERGFRVLDSIAQIAPLLGLFGTVLGMIDAFRALQAAGTAVDPSLLAGGIWVALLTTAVGLAVAMPTQIMLTWLESRVDRERSLAVMALERAFCPLGGETAQSRPIAHAV
ncbi:MotA/TolQ/ExbB proton channel family protein [Yoonia sp. BS5-3]|uniref:MotA/TolQ/ExbB proton channel family protein n=1 Tax=Yoonia phaeophyticola TaxID=3137369 RepID=A0ABZ2V2R1_9RHOB